MKHTQQLLTDTLGRQWIEIAGENPELVNNFKPCLVAFLAFDRGGTPGLAGAGFLIAGGDNLGLAITAKHVLAEGVVTIQRPVPRHSPSALFIPASSLVPSIQKERLRCLWLDSTKGEALVVPHVSYKDTLDIACCILMPQEATDTPFTFPRAIPLDTARPSIGEVIHMVSLDGMELVDHVLPNQTSRPGPFSIYHRISIRVGVVTALYPQGFRQYRWPCFTTSIPAEPGMSGGFVYFPRERYPIAACGIVCADNSSPEARSNQMICGESVIAYSWPALALNLPELLTPTAPSYTLHEMMRKGLMPPAIGGIDHIEISNRQLNGDCTIEYKVPQHPKQ